MLTRRQRQLLDYLRDYQAREQGISPSYDEIKEHMGLASRSGAHRLVCQLEERGYIRRLPARSRAIEVLHERQTVTVQAPKSLPLAVELQAALSDCKLAIRFFDKVRKAPAGQQAAVGQDHLVWLERACRNAARFAPRDDHHV